MKGKAMIFILILFASFVVNEKAFGFAEFPPKQQTQLVGSFALAGFVGIYAMIIFLRKSEYFHFSNWNEKDQKELSNY
jgi:hypothetical protein